MIIEHLPIADLAVVSSGGGAPQDAEAFSETGYPFVRAGSLSKLLEGAEEDELEKLQPEMAAEHGLKLFPAGTVLFAKSGMSATKGYVYRLKAPAYVVNHLAALVPRDPRDGAFLVRALEKYSPTSLIRDPAYPSIRLPDIEGFCLGAPKDAVERSRIAAILDQAGDLRHKRREALRKLEDLVESIFLKSTTSAEPGQDVWRPLGEIIKVRSGEFLPQQNQVDTGEYPVFGGNGINGHHDLLPNLPSFIRRVCSSFAPGRGVLRTQLA